MTSQPCLRAARKIHFKGGRRGRPAIAGLCLAVAVPCATWAAPVQVDQAQWEELQREARTARDIQDIQNLMSRRAMLHSIGHNEDELALWAKHQEIRWAQNGGCWIGDDYRKYYVTVNFAMQKAQLAALHKANPAIADDFAANRYIGQTVLHILSNPIIEIAEDGQSAKGFWYTPGAILMTPDGRTGQGMNMWERYGGDFVREDGQWRILHLEVITDFAYPFGGNLSSPIPGAPKPNDQSTSGSEGSKPAPGPGAEGIDVPGPTIAAAMGESYSPTRVPSLTPRLPMPYRTLSATFEYADCSHPPRSSARVDATLAHNPDMRPVADAIDTDHDGKMSRAEWQSAGLPMSSFNAFEHGRGYVTLEDYQTHPAPPGIDLNGDGKVTVEEFRAFDRTMSTQSRPPKP